MLKLRNLALGLFPSSLLSSCGSFSESVEPRTERPSPTLLDSISGTADVTEGIVPSPTSTPTPITRATPMPTSTVPPPLKLTALQRLAAGQPVTITYISMLDPTMGWAIGGAEDHVLRTDDGGETWHDVTPPEPAPIAEEPGKIASGFFLDANRA